MKIEGTTVVNVYKPPNTTLQDNSIPAFPLLVYMQQTCRLPLIANMHSHSNTWGYQSTDPDGKTNESWASAAVLQLLYNPKQQDSFHSGRWSSTTNPDLAFANIGSLTKWLVLNQFPKSQHIPSLISPINPIRSIPSKAVKRWNFRKANWSKLNTLS